MSSSANGLVLCVRAEPVWPAWTDQCVGKPKMSSSASGMVRCGAGGPVWPASARVVPVVVRWAFSQSVQARLGELVWLRGSIVIVEPVPVSAVLFFQLASAPTSNFPDRNRNWFPEDWKSGVGAGGDCGPDAVGVRDGGGVRAGRGARAGGGVRAGSGVRAGGGVLSVDEGTFGSAGGGLFSPSSNRSSNKLAPATPADGTCKEKLHFGQSTRWPDCELSTSSVARHWGQ